MKRIAIALIFLAAACVASAEEAQWATSWEKASQMAKQSGRPILAEFTGSDWCHPCMLLNENVFKSDVFGKWSKEHVVLLRLDYPRTHKQPAALVSANQKMLDRYRVAAFPTILFLNPSGQILGRYGYSGEGPSFWTKNAELIIKVGVDRMSARKTP